MGTKVSQVPLLSLPHPISFVSLIRFLMNMIMFHTHKRSRNREAFFAFIRMYQDVFIPSSFHLPSIFLLFGYTKSVFILCFSRQKAPSIERHFCFRLYGALRHCRYAAVRADDFDFTEFPSYCPPPCGSRFRGERYRFDAAICRKNGEIRNYFPKGIEFVAVMC